MKNISKFCFLFMIIIFGCDNAFSQVTYWEDLCFDTQMKMINDSNTYRGAVNYYYDRFTKNDSLTKNLLDTIATMPEFNPLYFCVFNKIMLYPESDLVKTLLISYCYRLFIRFSNEIMGYTAKDPIGDEIIHYCGFYAYEIGAGLSFNHNEDDKALKMKNIERLVEEFSKLSEENKTTARKFLDFFYRSSRSHTVE